jgi:hypothetical protein
MMKHRFARLTFVLGLPSLVAMACSGSSTLPPMSGENSTGGNAAGGWPNGQGGAPGSSSTGGTTPVVGSTGGSTSPSFGGYTTTTPQYGGYPTTTSTGGTTSTNPTACGTSGSLTMQVGGYVQTSTYKGYAWTGKENPAKGSTITPADFSACAANTTSLCVSGTVAQDSAYGGVAMLGINLNQAVAGGTGSELTYTPPSGGSVSVSLSNVSVSSGNLRVQIQAANATADTRWCVNISGSGGSYPLSSFNTQCWEGGSGTAYAGQPLQAVMILVPGSNSQAINFSFCLNSLSI